MARTTRSGMPPFFLLSNVIVWISAVVNMGILSYFIHQNGWVGRHIIYEEVIAVLTVAFFLISFVIGTYPGYVLLFNVIFSYLWLVSVVFTANDWSNAYAGPLAHTVEAFSFVAFFFLLFNILYDWHLGYGGGRISSAV